VFLGGIFYSLAQTFLRYRMCRLAIIHSVTDRQRYDVNSVQYDRLNNVVKMSLKRLCTVCVSSACS